MLTPASISHYVNRGIPKQLDIYSEIDRDPLSARDSSSTAVSIESQTESSDRVGVVDLHNYKGKHYDF